MVDPFPVKSVIAPVKSPWYSKVNWIQGVGATVVFINELSPLLPEKYKHWATLAVVLLTGGSTIIVKTFFTTSISSSSVS